MAPGVDGVRHRCVKSVHSAGASWGMLGDKCAGQRVAVPADQRGCHP